ncbi:hypothetical protein [Imhoffiella purpurea]|uniref:(3R)-hydroxymyristoyl-[ACP] dehydratase n=1 Tax=Imhoffiella purpurea TaxID=1249627 RepID=W9V9V2_9GAMM|nr:hypothetical protein [Imhoffiella purpurea]EXJ16234.1 (3R)-hydroxymyristoyl-[ACP] dehydratase [Imhoffiella purpurea]
MKTRARFSVPAEHPALAGHFPGNPMVPGSVILEQILALCPAGCARLDHIKFQRPLIPGREAEVEFEPTGDGSALSFRCLQDERPICAGRLSLAP